MSNLSRRNFLGLTGLAIAGAGLASCAGSGSPASSGGSGTAGGGAPLEFWSNHPGQSKEVEQKLIAAFTQKTGIQVKLIDAGKNYEEVQNKLNGALAGKQLPDAVVLSDVTWFNFALNKQLAPVDELLGKVSLSSADYVDSLYADYRFNGHNYALPYSRSTPLFYYNKDLWSKAGLPDRGPKTWAEFAEWAPKLAASVGGDKSAMILADGTQYLDWYFQGMIWTFGGAFSREWTPAFLEEGSIKAAEYLKKLVTSGQAKIGKDPATKFASGIAGCLLESTGAMGGIKKSAKFEFGTAFLPADDGTPGCPTGGAGIGIPVGISDERKLNAVKFVEFMTNPENTVTFTQATGYMPVRKSASKVPAQQDFLEKNPNAKTAVMQLPRTKSQDNARVLVPGGGLRIGKALDKIVQGGDVKEVFTALSKETQDVIDRDITPKL